MILELKVYVIPISIFCKGVSSFVTGYPGDVCGRESTTHPCMSVQF